MSLVFHFDGFTVSLMDLGSWKMKGFFWLYLVQMSDITGAISRGGKLLGWN